MIVRQFLHWLRTALPGERAEATSALARAYLYSDLSDADRAAAEGAMIMLLDDPSPLVRLALSSVFAGSPWAPSAIVHSLAADQPDVAAPLLERSPLLLDADLVEAIASGETERQLAVARRAALPRTVAAALAEVGTAEACLVLVENSDADIAPAALERIVVRHGHLAAIREALLRRDDLGPALRQALVVRLSETLAAYTTARAWLTAPRAERVVREACEKATIVIADDATDDEIGPLIRHLRATSQLNAGLVLRALLCGNFTMFEEALAELTDLPLGRVAGIVHDRRGAGFRALYERAGLPPSAFHVFRDALDAIREEGFIAEPGGASRLKRRIIERVLTRYEEGSLGDIEPLLTLLRRYAAEAVRDEARTFCDELVADDRIAFGVESPLLAA
jgi:uncharacterized protein (DUF2336 family)